MYFCRERPSRRGGSDGLAMWIPHPHSRDQRGHHSGLKLHSWERTVAALKPGACDASVGGASPCVVMVALAHPHLYAAQPVLLLCPALASPATPTCSARPSPAQPRPFAVPCPHHAGHTHLLDALQSVIGLLDVPVHRIHSGRFTEFYPRAMNVVQPVERGQMGQGGTRPADLTPEALLPLARPSRATWKAHRADRRHYWLLPACGL